MNCIFFLEKTPLVSCMEEEQYILFIMMYHELKISSVVDNKFPINPYPYKRHLTLTSRIGINVKCQRSRIEISCQVSLVDMVSQW
jgi:hypothetical protein